MSLYTSVCLDLTGFVYFNVFLFLFYLREKKDMQLDGYGGWKIWERLRVGKEYDQNTL